MTTYEKLSPLYPDIKTCIKIVPAAETTCKRGIMPAAQVSYYNQINVGIFLCFIDLCLKHERLQHERLMHVDEGKEADIYFFWHDTDKIISAKYDRREAAGFWRWEAA